MRPKHFIVPLLLVALAFAVGQVAPGFGIFVALGGSFLWMGLEQRRAGRIGPAASDSCANQTECRSDQ